jgi:hypothetical protein
MPDFDFIQHGSICLLTPLSEAAQEWAKEHLPEDVMLWGKHSLVIEPRYAEPILTGISDAGLTVYRLN